MAEQVFRNLFKSGERERFTALKEFYTDKDINYKTDLTDKEIEAIMMLEFVESYVEEEWNIKLDLTSITLLFKQLKVSRNRLGRTEAITVLREQAEHEMKQNKSLLQKITGF